MARKLKLKKKSKSTDSSEIGVSGGIYSSRPTGKNHGKNALKQAMLGTITDEPIILHPDDYEIPGFFGTRVINDVNSGYIQIQRDIEVVAKINEKNSYHKWKCERARQGSGQQLKLLISQRGRHYVYEINNYPLVILDGRIQFVADHRWGTVYCSPFWTLREWSDRYFALNPGASLRFMKNWSNKRRKLLSEGEELTDDTKFGFTYGDATEGQLQNVHNAIGKGAPGFSVSKAMMIFLQPHHLDLLDKTQRTPCTVLYDFSYRPIARVPHLNDAKREKGATQGISRMDLKVVMRSVAYPSIFVADVAIASIWLKIVAAMHGCLVGHITFYFLSITSTKLRSDAMQKMIKLQPDDFGGFPNYLDSYNHWPLPHDKELIEKDIGAKESIEWDMMDMAKIHAVDPQHIVDLMIERLPEIKTRFFREWVVVMCIGIITKILNKFPVKLVGELFEMIQGEFRYPVHVWLTKSAKGKKALPPLPKLPYTRLPDGVNFNERD